MFKISTLHLFSALVAAFFLLTNAAYDPNNPPTGRTGAPGELTCADANCHSGGNFTGTVSVSGLPDTVVAGTTYTLTLTNTSNAVRAGFQMTCWDANNAMCGTFTAPAGSGVNIGSGASGKRYARQSTPKLLALGQTSWTYTWRAPVAAAGNKATFYFVSLCANNDEKNSGDNVLKADKTVVLKAASPTQETLPESAYSIYPTLIHDGLLFIDLKELNEAELMIVNAAGRIAKKQLIKGQMTLDISHLSSGTYTALLKADGKTALKKFVVE